MSERLYCGHCRGVIKNYAEFLVTQGIKIGGKIIPYQLKVCPDCLAMLRQAGKIINYRRLKGDEFYHN